MFNIIRGKSLMTPRTKYVGGGKRYGLIKYFRICKGDGRFSLIGNFLSASDHHYAIGTRRYGATCEWPAQGFRRSYSAIIISNKPL